MTKQEVFDEVSEHLIKQGEKSLRFINGKGFNAYYGVGGTRCAVGCLIPDYMYNENLEGKSLLCPNVHRALGALAEDEDIMCLLADLQDMHDNSPVNLWPQRLTDIAFENDLEMAGELLYINQCWDSF